MDNSMLGDFDSLLEEDKLRMSAMIDQLQLLSEDVQFTGREMLFRLPELIQAGKSLDKQEETCVRHCADKFLKHSMRVGMRFAELNQGTATPD